MNIAVINGSPKLQQSNSGELISIIRTMVDTKTGWTAIAPVDVERRQLVMDMSSIIEADVLLFVFPLYSDGIPVSLMRFMAHLASKKSENLNKKPQRLFAIVNCGFHEGIQSRIALKMMEHFSETAGFEWCGGVGIGTGEMITVLKKVSPQSFIKKPVTIALQVLADAINEGASGKLMENIYTRHAFPWLFYKLMGEIGWRQQAKKNGLKKNGLHSRPLAGV